MSKHGERIKLSDHFTYGKLVKFVMPSIGMMVFTSIYGVVDGYFVSNYTGNTAFAATNLIWPFLMLFSAIGFMIGAGGTALISYNLGVQDEKKAKRIFSLLVYMVIIFGIIFTVIGEVVLEGVSRKLGATEEMLPYCVKYGRILIFALTPFMLQNLFQSFVVVAEKPKLGLVVTVLSGVANMIGDAVLVGILNKGVEGAAIATALSQCIGGIIPLVYFIMPNNSRLRLGKTRVDFGAIVKTCTNGSSEFLTNVSMSAVNMLYNIQLLKYAGSDGVSAYGVIMYVCFIFISIFIGYAVGIAPIIGYNYGAGNTDELHNIFGKSIKMVSCGAISMFALGELLSSPLAKIYVGYDAKLFDMTVSAFHLYAVTFLILGFNIFASAFFTALGNGAVSACISVLRTLVFQLVSVLLLPMLLGLNGIWLANVFAEFLALIVSTFFIVKMRHKYQYM